MADNVIWSAIYLGNFADMDTDEGSYTQEDTSALLTTFGAGPGNALANNVVEINSSTGWGDNLHNSNNSFTADTVKYDLGAGTITARVDSIAVLNGTVTFYDGSTLTGAYGTFQDDQGNVFLLALDSQPELGSVGIDTITFTSVVSTDFTGIYQDTKDDVDFVCFGPGTKIDTPLGPKRADRLNVGDYVTTLDDGPQPIRWIGKRRLRFDTPHPAQPVRIAKNAFGGGRPKRDLILSPNHRVLVETRATHALHDPLGALAPVKALTRHKGIRFAAGRRAITYFSFLLPGHAVLIAEGIAVESLYPGPEVWRQLSGPERCDWMRLAARGRVTGLAPARLMLSTSEARAALACGGLTLPSEAPRAARWSARTRRAANRPLPLHLAAGRPF